MHGVTVRVFNVFMCVSRLIYQRETVVCKSSIIPLIDVQNTNVSERFAVLDKNRYRESPFSWKIMLWNQRISPPVKIRFIKNGLYGIDETESEVVEFFRCGKVDDRVSEGRIYIQTSFFDDRSNFVKKGDQFIKWYESLARWIKKHAVLTKETWRGKMYVMKAAYEFFERSSE